jgi:glycosyltransferase involved in cell wall biosynthesis
MQVGWKVNALAANIASVRYRAVLPMIALESTQVRSRLFSSGLESNLDELDVLVIVKSFTADDLRLAQLAAARGIRVVYDLCDNIFIGEYGSKRGLTPAQMFLSIAEHARCIVATTEPLAEAIRAHVPDVPVVVIPDGIESAALGKRIARLLRDAAGKEKSERTRMLRQRVGNVIRRVRIEGVQLIPSLVGYVARRVGGVVARRVHRGLHRQPRAAEQARLPAPDAASPRRRIVWFGNHGAEHARFGMLDILLYREALEALAAELDVELVVISNNREKYQASIAPLAIPSQYVEWSSRVVDAWLAQAAVTIMPNTLDAFSLCKSANRTVLALSHGVPVVATMTPALHPLGDFVHTGEPLAALREILANPEQSRAMALQGYRHAESLFGMKAIQMHWLNLLRDLPDALSGQALSQPYLAVVLHLVQDLDLALPILSEARSAGLTCEAWCSGVLLKKSPRVLAMLKNEQIPFKVLPEEASLARFTFPARTRVLLTVAETNLGPHRIPRLLSEAAVCQGLLVATLQHGFENVGLSYDDNLHGMDKVTIAAQRIYIWGPLHTLHPRATATVRARCVPVGCPKEAAVPPANLEGMLPAGRPVVGIFENLHWHRYSDEYRNAFMANVAALTRAFPEVFFLLKPHHAGMWLTHKYEGEPPAGDNLVIADPQSPAWENHTASALLGHLAAVITTPSTVALDAARVGLPVAVAAGGLYLDNYLPLTVLETESEWVDFVARALDADRRGPLQEQSERFVNLVLTPGNAARRIVEDLRATAGA